MDDNRIVTKGGYGVRGRFQAGGNRGVDRGGLYTARAGYDMVPSSGCMGAGNGTANPNRYHLNIRNIRYWVAVVCALGFVGSGVRAYQVPVTVTYLGAQRWRIRTSGNVPSVGENTWCVSVKSNTAMAGGIPTTDGQYWNVQLPLGSTLQYIYTDINNLKLFAILYSNTDPTLPSQTWQYTLTEDPGNVTAQEYVEPSGNDDTVASVMESVKTYMMEKLSTIGLRLGQLLSLVLAIVWIKRDWKRRMRNENG